MSKDDMAFWLYSSGSTGFPKGAVHLHHDMLYVSDLVGQQIMQITEADRTFSAAKLFFAYGLGNNLYIPMRFGAAGVLLPDRPTPEAVFDTITRYHPTVFYGVPTLYAQMLQVEDAPARYDLSSLRLCVSAGESLPPEIFRRWPFLSRSVLGASYRLYCTCTTSPPNFTACLPCCQNMLSYN